MLKSVVDSEKHGGICKVLVSGNIVYVVGTSDSLNMLI